MKVPLPGSIKSMVTLIVALALMPAFGLMVYSGYSGTQSALDDMSRSSLRAARNIARQQTILVEGTRVLLLTLANLAEVRARDTERCTVLLQNLALHAPVYADIRLCDMEGNTLASANPSAPELSPSAREHVRNLAVHDSAFSVQELSYPSSQGALFINCLLPVHDNGQAVAILLASIKVHASTIALTKLIADNAGCLHIVDKGGRPVFVYPPAEDARHEKGCDIAGVWQEIADSGKSYGHWHRGKARVAFEKLFLCRNASAPELTIMLKSVSTEAVLEQMRSRIIKNVLLLFGVACFAVAITWKLTNVSLRAPVHRLLSAANRIKDGDLTTRISESFIAEEWNILAESLNSMTRALEARDNELIAARDLATTASTSKSEFLATMSHEIRTPMNAILGMIYLAKNSELTDKQRKYLDNIHEEADKLLALINDILDFSKIEAGKLRIESVSFSLRDTLSEVLRAAEDESWRNSVTFSSSLAPDLPQSLDGDPFHLSQVLSIVLHHAILHAEQGRVMFHCGIDSRKIQEIQIVFTITCLGDEEGNEAFARAYHMTEDEEGVTGFKGGRKLSMKIARNLVALMQGRMEARAGAGLGGTVSIRIPFLNAAPLMEYADTPLLPPDVRDSQMLGEPGQDASPKDGAPSNFLKNARVLLVEDNLINQQIAEEILTAAGASVHIAANGLEALAMLGNMPKGAPYHVVLMDLQMPELDGFATTRRLRLEERFKNLPIIAMSAHTMADEWHQCREVGINDYIIKPLDVPVFLATVKKWACPAS